MVQARSLGYVYLIMVLIACGRCSEMDRQISMEIQELRENIKNLNRELQLEKTRRQQLETRLDNLNRDRKDEMSRLVSLKVQDAKFKLKQYIDSNENEKKVIFSARVGNAISDLDPWQTIVFRSVLINAGNSYSHVTGQFTAPVAGWYVFFSTILSKPGFIIETSLQVNGVNKMYLYSAGRAGAHGAGSNMVIVHLVKGDVVKMVKHGPWGTRPFYIHHTWSTFSGFLLIAEESAVIANVAQ